MLVNVIYYLNNCNIELGSYLINYLIKLIWGINFEKFKNMEYFVWLIVCEWYKLKGYLVVCE